MKKRRRREEPINHERWLVSYADLITLLFALFVVMYAMSRADAVRFRQVAEGLRRAFAEGVLPQQSQSQAPTQPSSGSEASAQGEGSAQRGARASGTASAQDAAQAALRDRLLSITSSVLGEAGAVQGVQGEEVPDGFLLKLGIRGMYAPGRAEPDPDLVPLVDRLGEELRDSGAEIRLEGHTDAEDGAGPGWSLGAQRAAWVAERWIRKLKWDPHRVGVVSFGPHHSPADGSSADGSGQAGGLGRRVEVRVLRAAK